MRPCGRKSLPSSFFLQQVEVGPIVSKIKGSTKKLGQQYQDATVVLYNKANFQPIAIKRPDQNGNYQFLGLNTDLQTFIVAFDKKQQFNAVIQDNVRPE